MRLGDRRHGMGRSANAMPRILPGACLRLTSTGSAQATRALTQVDEVLRDHGSRRPQAPGGDACAVGQDELSRKLA